MENLADRAGLDAERIDDPKADRTVRNYLSKMDQYDVIQAARTSRDKTYRPVSETFETLTE